MANGSKRYKEKKQVTEIVCPNCFRAYIKEWIPGEKCPVCEVGILKKKGSRKRRK